jgi:hypothetical protein
MALLPAHPRRFGLLQAGAQLGEARDASVTAAAPAVERAGGRADAQPG